MDLGNLEHDSCPLSAQLWNQSFEFNDESQLDVSLEIHEEDDCIVYETVYKFLEL